MAVDRDRVLGAELPDAEASWCADDVMLYHLGLGAGDPPTDPAELAYTFEGTLKVLPSFAVVPVMPVIFGMFGLPGLEVDLTRLLHGEQDLEIHDDLPAEGRIVTSARVADVFDKGKAALVILEAVSRAAEDGRPLFTNRFSLFLRGEGGFGGPTGPGSRNEPPGRPPDRVVTSATLPQQALIYRLAGDKNPLHADPEFARRGGFDRPILHGLCSYGMACRSAVEHALGGDVGVVGRYEARFAGVIFPGETLETSIWDEGDRLLLGARCVERDAPVLSNCAITKRG